MSPSSQAAENLNWKNRAVVAGKVATTGASGTGPTPTPRLCRSIANFFTVRYCWPSSDASNSAVTFTRFTGCTVTLRAVKGDGISKVTSVRRARGDLRHFAFAGRRGKRQHREILKLTRRHRQFALRNVAVRAAAIPAA